MSLHFKFDPDKAVEVILYIAEQCPDKYHLLKILYFADKDHLAKYGRFICGDAYIAMGLGPVPSGTYDLVKQGGLVSYLRTAEHRSVPFTVSPRTVIPLRQPDLEWLSKSDIECLDIAIAKYKDLPVTKLKYISHQDKVYKSSPLNGIMPLEEIAINLPEGEILLEYLRDC